jgi:RHS repeat-associated protein
MSVRALRRLVTRLTVTALVAAGLGAMPELAGGASRAAADPGLPFACDFPSGSPSSPPPTRRMSVNTSGGSITDQAAFDPSMSADGRFVSFTSGSAQHVAGDTNGKNDIFVRDRLLDTTERVSVAPGGVAATGESLSSSISADGRYVAYASTATNLLGGDGDPAASFSTSERVQMVDAAIHGATTLTLEAWIRTTSPGPIFAMTNQAYPTTPTQQIPVLYVDTDGKLRGQFWNNSVNQMVSSASVNDDVWHHVALTAAGSTQSMFLDGALVGTRTGAITHLSMVKNYVGFGYSGTGWPKAWTGWTGLNGRIDEVALYRSALSAPTIAARFAARTDNYSALVTASSPWLYHRLNEATGATSAADSSGNGRTGTRSSGVALSPFGALTVDTNDADDVFLRDRTTQATERVSLTTLGAQSATGKGSLEPVITADGQEIGFYTKAALISTDTNDDYDVYVRHRATQTTERVSLTNADLQVDGDAKFQGISADGEYVVFTSFTDAFAPTLDTNGKLDIYLRNLVDDSTTLISKNASGVAANGDSYYPTVAANGRSVAFHSFATDLVSLADTNQTSDVFVRTLRNGVLKMTRASSRPGQASATGTSDFASVSGDGDTVVFESTDSQLVANDNNGVRDVFAYDFNRDTTERVSTGTNQEEATGASSTESPGMVSADGRVVAFHSTASNLVGTGVDANGLKDVFVRDRSATNGWNLATSLSSSLVAQSDEVGLEQHMAYTSLPVGTGTAYTNLRTGNLVAQFEDAVVPGVGLNVVLRRTYNEARKDIDTGLGKGWSLSVADVTAGADGASGADSSFDGFDVGSAITTSSFGSVVNGVFSAAGQIIEFTDGDGTTHRFVRRGGPCERWDSPPGVSLRVREVFGSSSLFGLPDAYEFVRPDGVIYRAERQSLAQPTTLLPLEDWRVTSISDRRGNELALSYSNNATALPRWRLTGITHNRYPTQKAVELKYKPTNGIEWIKTYPGLTAPEPSTGQNRTWTRQIDFNYDDPTQELRSAAEIEGGRTTTYDYTGGDFKVTDARGNPTTVDIANGRVTSISDRRGKSWTYGYSTDGQGVTTTTATAPVDTGATSTTTYTISPRAAIADGRIAGGNITRIADAGHGTPNTPVVTDIGWTANRLTSVSNALAQASSYTYNDLGQLKSVTRPAPNASDNANETNDPTTSITTTLKYDYPLDFTQESTECTDPGTSGVVSSEGWCSAVGELVRTLSHEADPTQSRMTHFTFDDIGNLERVVQRANPDPNQATDTAPSAADRATTFAYYERGSLKSVNGPRDDVLDAADITTYGNLADLTYGGYDRSGLATSITDANQQTKTFEYTPYGLVGKTTDRDDRVTKALFDERDNLTETTDPAGRVTTTTYDLNDNRKRITRPSGGNRYNEAAYDNNDWPTQVSSPAADTSEARTTVSRAYFDDGTVKTETNPRGGLTTLTYWPNRALRSTDGPAGTGVRAIADHYYDAVGRENRTVMAAVNAAGDRPERQVLFNPNGSVRQAKTTAANGAITSTVDVTYNAFGEAIRTDGPRAVGGVTQATRTSFDRFGQAASAQQRKDATNWITSSMGYDLAGNRTSQTNPTTVGVLTTTYTYDELNRLEQQDDPSVDNHAVEFGYENEGRQKRRTDLFNNARVREVLTEPNADGTISSQTATTYGTGGSTIATCNFAAGAAADSGYDTDGNLLTSRALTGGDCVTGTLQKQQTFTYDDRGWVDSSTQAIRSPLDGSMVTRSETLTYERDGQWKTAEHANRTTSYQSSTGGLLESITDWNSKQSTTSYYASGAPNTESVANGAATATFGWLANGAPSSLVWKHDTTTLRSHTMAAGDYDDTLRTGEDVTVRKVAGGTEGAHASYSYDLLDRLTAFTSPFVDPDATDRLTTTYSLDDGGNIGTATVTKASNGAAWSSTTSTYATGRVTSQAVDEASPTADHVDGFGYDDLGQEDSRTIDSNATRTTAYDGLGHVTTLDDTTATNADVTYIYDAADRLISRHEPNAAAAGRAVDTLYFTWPTGAIAEEADGAGNTLARYVPGAGGGAIGQEVFAVVNGLSSGSTGTWGWLLSDASGSVATIINNAGDVVSQAAFDPYGKPSKAGSTDTATPKSTFGYQGAPTDRATGALLLGARQYDPKTARFTTPDFFVAAQLDLALGSDSLTGNRYLFAAANPVGFYENGYWPSFSKLVKAAGKVVKAAVNNNIVRSVAIGVAIGAVCVGSAGIGCAIGVGAAVGVGFGAARYGLKSGNKSYGGLAKALVGGALQGAAEGWLNGVGRQLRLAKEARTALQVAADGESGAQKAGLPFRDPALDSRVRQTIENIDNGVTRYRQDGTIFQNREGLLPKEGVGYYREFTVDNPATSGRGAERVIVGANGETYFTPDHYDSFVRIR